MGEEIIDAEFEVITPAQEALSPPRRRWTVGAIAQYLAGKIVWWVAFIAIIAAMGTVGGWLVFGALFGLTRGVQSLAG